MAFEYVKAGVILVFSCFLRDSNGISYFLDFEIKLALCRGVHYFWIVDSGHETAG